VKRWLAPILNNNFRRFFLWNAFRKKTKNTVTALIVHATEKTGAANVCTITGKTENSLRVFLIKKMNAPMTAQ